MKVAVYYNNHDIRLEDRTIPSIGVGEILVKVTVSGICGTDIMEWYRVKKAPRVLGHEIVGEIVESKSDHFQVGQRVFVSHHVPCNTCKYCLEDHHSACDTLHQGNYDPGGYSEYVRVPHLNVENGVYVLPYHVTDEEGSWTEPLACAVRAQRVINVKPQHTVLILGSGVSGLLNLQVAKQTGARVIMTDIHPFRKQKAVDYGADQVLDARDDLSAIKADKIIICTGAYAAVEQAFQCVDKKGTILFFAIPQQDVSLPIVDFWRNELTVTSSYGAAPRDLDESLQLIADKKIDVQSMITHRLPLKDIQQAFQLAAAGGECLKVVLNP
jgi:L-iditol 2-dehydrogenase